MSRAAGRLTPPEQVVFQKLDAGLHCRLTLLVAPAGAGKTRALRAWAAARQPGVHPLVWLELQPADNHPAQFLNRLTAALQPFLPDPLPTQTPSWTPGPGSPLETVIDLINAVTEDGVDFSSYWMATMPSLTRSCTRPLSSCWIICLHPCT